MANFAEKPLCQTSPFPCKGQLFLGTATAQGVTLAEAGVDAATQSATLNILHGQVPVTVLNAIGFRRNDHQIYGWNHIDEQLLRMDASGEITILKNLPLHPENRYYGGDLTSNGRFLVLVGGGIYDTELAVIDLETPDYEVNFIPLHGALTQSFDVAFDPRSGLLYAFDCAENRLVIFDVNSGEILRPFPPTGSVHIIGSLFFDAFGNLYGFGSQVEGNQNTVFGFDKNTGEILFLKTGPEVSASDGCSCPYTVDIQLVATPETIESCDTLHLHFILVNNTGETLDGTDLTAALPDGFTIAGISKNPFGGDVESGAGDPFLSLKNLTIQAGIDTLSVSVEAGEVEEGTYFTQAALAGLPAKLGGIRLSENPAYPLARAATGWQVAGSHCPVPAVEALEESIFAPNVFSPNHDGINDYFFLQSFGPLPVRRISVFNRWGGMVFEANEIFTNDPAAGWDGRFDGRPAMAGSYAWVAEVLLPDGKLKRLAGDVSILK